MLHVILFIEKGDVKLSLYLFKLEINIFLDPDIAGILMEKEMRVD